MHSVMHSTHRATCIAQLASILITSSALMFKPLRLSLPARPPGQAYRQGVGDTKPEEHCDRYVCHIELELSKGDHVKACHEGCQVAQGSQLLSMPLLHGSHE